MELSRCPLCESRRIRRVRETVTFGKGKRKLVVPNLSFHRCFSCREGFFDAEANRVIDEFHLRWRRSRPRPRALST